MSNIQVNYATFDVEDFKREAKLSSYNLPFTPLTFKARIPSSLGGEAVTTQYNTLKATFDFGDGTYGKTLTSTIHISIQVYTMFEWFYATVIIIVY
jgi:hypothetical protein